MKVLLEYNYRDLIGWSVLYSIALCPCIWCNGCESRDVGIIWFVWFVWFGKFLWNGFWWILDYEFMKQQKYFYQILEHRI